MTHLDPVTHTDSVLHDEALDIAHKGDVVADKQDPFDPWIAFLQAAAPVNQDQGFAASRWASPLV
jgi:hypothetical protein